jgi:hypothetical protein
MDLWIDGGDTYLKRSTRVLEAGDHSALNKEVALEKQQKDAANLLGPKPSKPGADRANRADTPAEGQEGQPVG